MDAMSNCAWRCRNPNCGRPHGAVLGTLKDGTTLELRPGVRISRAHLDRARAVVLCPVCHAPHIFEGGSIYAPEC
jgi:hypothetical protein